MHLDECLELADELGVATAIEVGIDTILERGESKLLEPRGLGLRPRLVGEVGERGAPPERERCRELRGPAERGEPCGAESMRSNSALSSASAASVEPVAAGVSHDRLLAKRLSEM